MATNSQTLGASADLGFGGAELSQQVQDETEEQRKKRMQQMQQQALGPAGSLASATLFGGIGAPGT